MTETTVALLALCLAVLAATGAVAIVVLVRKR